MPMLYLEYMPLRSLEFQNRNLCFSYAECCQVNYQCSLGLKYLHQEGIVHRDIKPGNILVQNRDANRNAEILWVKLSDFGLSKKGSLKTFCGSRTYFPPEILDGGKKRYTKAVDIWSLGIVVYELAYGLPHPGYHDSKRCTAADWCKSVVDDADDWESEGLIDILQRMLVIAPTARLAATAVVREASRLLTSSRGQAISPTPKSYAAGHGAGVSHQFGRGRERYGWEGEKALDILPPQVCFQEHAFRILSFSLMNIILLRRITTTRSLL